MSGGDLERLLPVATARYEAEFAAVRGLLAAEAQCRAQLARLDVLAQSGRDQAMRLGPMQVLGADVLFQKSLAENRVRLNGELAQILARKASAMDKVRLAFGRKQAIETSLERQDVENRRKINLRRHNAAMAPWLMGPGSRAE